jgi:hypothetical protein
MKNLGEAIEKLQEAVNLTPKDHPARPGCCRVVLYLS